MRPKRLWIVGAGVLFVSVGAAACWAACISGYPPSCRSDEMGLIVKFTEISALGCMTTLVIAAVVGSVLIGCTGRTPWRRWLLGSGVFVGACGIGMAIRLAVAGDFVWNVALRQDTGTGMLGVLVPGRQERMFLCKESATTELWTTYRVLVAGDGHALPFIRPRREGFRRAPRSTGTSDADLECEEYGNGWCLVGGGGGWFMMGWNGKEGRGWSAKNDFAAGSRSLSVFALIGGADKCDEGDIAALEVKASEAVRLDDRVFFSLAMVDDDLMESYGCGIPTVRTAVRRLSQVAGPGVLPKTAMAIGE